MSEEKNDTGAKLERIRSVLDEQLSQAVAVRRHPSEDALIVYFPTHLEPSRSVK